TRWPAASRMSGVRRRSGCSSVAAADQPLTHRPPAFTGNFGLPRIFTPTTPEAAAGGPEAMCIPHCSAQYGQCVATVVGKPFMAKPQSKTCAALLPGHTPGAVAQDPTFLSASKSCETNMFDFSDARLLAGGEPPFRHAFGDKFEWFSAGTHK